MQFSTRGGSVRLDVDELNERMAVKGRLRLRHSMKPDEGYGMVFSFDGVICDTQSLKKEAWMAVAQLRGAALVHLLHSQLLVVLQALLDACTFLSAASTIWSCCTTSVRHAQGSASQASRGRRCIA
jgi:hypothetical protein